MAHNPFTPEEQSNENLSTILASHSGAAVLRHFAGYPLIGMPPSMNQAAIVCLDMEWWYKVSINRHP